MQTAATPEGTQLTERQARYLGLADEGKTHREIAVLCGVSVGTVSSTIYHVRNRALSIAGERELTARQLEILCLVGIGMSDRQIGDRLYLSRRTIENHIRMARDRLGARNRMQCVMLAISRELLILDCNGQILVPHAHRVAAVA